MSTQDGVADPLEQLEQLRDRIAKQMITVAGVCSIALMLWIQGGSFEPRTFAVGIGMLAVFGGAYTLIHHGRGRLGRWLLMVTLLAGLMVRAGFLGGANSLHFTVVVFVPLLASAFLSARASWGFAVVAVAGGAVLVGLGGAGLLPPSARELGPGTALAFNATVLAIAAVVGTGMASGVRSALINRAAAERSRAETEERYALAASGANYGAWDWDLTKDSLWLAPGVSEILGEQPQARTVDASWWAGRMHPEDRHTTWQFVQERLLAGDGSFEAEYRVRHESGGWIWVQSRGRGLRNEDGDVHRAVGSFADVSDLRTMREALEHRALHDGLTGLPNRSLFLRVVNQALSAEPQWAVLFVDLDRFKDLNDSFGHAAGDRILAEVADRLRASLKAADLVARVGGDEFAILLAEVEGLVHAESVAERLLKALREPVRVDGSEVLVHVSLGVLVGDATYVSAEDVMRDVDFAMYASKSQPDVPFTAFHPSMRREFRHVLELDLQLRRALENHRFVPWFQPIVDLETRRTVGWESLVRWEQEDGSIVQPGAFLPRAEEIGLLPDIDRFLVREACSEVADWSVVGEPQMLSVNLSARQFTRPDTVAWFEDMLHRTGMPPSRLQIEVTEQTLLTDRGDVKETMGRLRALGVMLALDDFGTGYSSLGYLESFPLDVLKIDRRFVQGGRGGKPGPICAAIVSMASSLGMVVVAEGVETERQRDALLELGCTRGQGWLFGRPAATRSPGSAAG